MTNTNEPTWWLGIYAIAVVGSVAVWNALYGWWGIAGCAVAYALATVLDCVYESGVRAGGVTGQGEKGFSEADRVGRGAGDA